MTILYYDRRPRKEILAQIICSKMVQKENSNSINKWINYYQHATRFEKKSKRGNQCGLFQKFALFYRSHSSLWRGIGMKNWQFFQKFFYLMCAVKISLGNLEFLTPLWYYVLLKVCSIDIGSFFMSVQFGHFKGL